MSTKASVKLQQWPDLPLANHSASMTFPKSNTAAGLRDTRNSTQIQRQPARQASATADGGSGNNGDDDHNHNHDDDNDTCVMTQISWQNWEALLGESQRLKEPKVT